MLHYYTIETFYVKERQSDKIIQGSVEPTEATHVVRAISI